VLLPDNRPLFPSFRKELVQALAQSPDLGG
jgi:hypothetical protein